MRKLEINAPLFNRLFPEASRREMEARLACALLWGDPEKLPEANLEYFAHLGSYAGRAKDLPDGLPVLNDLFPPNIAVLDYAVKFLQPEGERVLDFACGLGGLIVCLHSLGYAAAGFDRWTQCSFRMANRFVESYGCYPPSVFVDIRPSTLVFVGGHWDWITPDDARAIFTPALKRVLVDANYAPQEIAGFDLAAEYEGLLQVFERAT